MHLAYKSKEAKRLTVGSTCEAYVLPLTTRLSHIRLIPREEVDGNSAGASRYFLRDPLTACGSDAYDCMACALVIAVVFVQICLACTANSNWKCRSSVFQSMGAQLRQSNETCDTDSPNKTTKFRRINCQIYL